MRSIIHSRRAVRRLMTSLSVLAAVLMGACGPASAVPPGITVDRSACDHCLMLISEPEYAAAFRIGGREGVFDDIDCLLRELGSETDPAAAQVWFHDFNNGGWVTADDAVFLRSPQLPTPMASGIVAVRDRPAATALIDRYEAEIIGTFAELLDLVEEAEAPRPGTKDGSHGQ